MFTNLLVTFPHSILITVKRRGWTGVDYCHPFPLFRLLAVETLIVAFDVSCILINQSIIIFQSSLRAAACCHYPII